MKIPPALEELLEEGLIDDVHRQLLSGKEASVYVVSRDGLAIAAKVYKERNNRTFKNVTSYVEGRNQTRNTRDKRAKSRKTKYGRELLEQSWRSMEHDALQRAFMGGVRVPEPYLLSGDVLLMEYLCDEDGEPAPRLSDIEIPYEVAKLLHLEVYQQTRRMLAAGLIHGDLSAFNVLVAPNGLTIIDLPQVVDASANSEAKELLLRDLRNVTEFFARFDAGLLEFLECGEGLWNHYTRGTLDKADEPEKARGNRKAGRGRRGRAGEGGLGGREDKHANRPKRAPQPRDNAARPTKDERSNGSNGSNRGGRPAGRQGGESKPNEGQKRAEGRPPRNRNRRPPAESSSSRSTGTESSSSRSTGAESSSSRSTGVESSSSRSTGAESSSSRSTGAEPSSSRSTGAEPSSESQANAGGTQGRRRRKPSAASNRSPREENATDRPQSQNRAPTQRRRGPVPRREVEIERAPSRPPRSDDTSSADSKPAGDREGRDGQGRGEQGRGGQGRGGQGRGGQGRGGQGRGGQGRGGQGRGGQGGGTEDRAQASDNSESDAGPRRRRRRPSAPDTREP